MASDSDLKKEVDRLSDLVTALTLHVQRLEHKIQQNEQISAPSVAAPPPQPPTIVRGTTPRKVCVLFDFETGGLGKTEDIRVCQIGATAVDENLNVLGHFTHFVNPLVQMDVEAIAVHNFSQEFVEKFDDWGVVGRQFMEWMETMRNNDGDVAVTLCAHNGKRFDARIICFSHARHNISWPRNYHHSDSIEIFKSIYPGEKTYSLGALYKSILGKELESAHDAAADVGAVYELMTNTDAPSRVFDTIVEHRESINLIIKRCFKKKG